MLPVPPSLAQSYQLAWASYVTDWQHVDAELVNLVQTRNTGSFQDVHLRVVFMNGVYRAQLNRTVGSNADFLAAMALQAQWPTVTAAVAPLAAFAAPSAAAMLAVVAAHQAIITILQGAFPNAGRPTSFASKFLWPDAPNLVPIFDGNTGVHARQHVQGYVGAVPGVVAAMTVSTADPVYLKHAIRYLATYQTLTAAVLPPSVPLTMKGIDHMYWLG